MNQILSRQFFPVFFVPKIIAFLFLFRQYVPTFYFANSKISICYHVQIVRGECKINNFNTLKWNKKKNMKQCEHWDLLCIIKGRVWKKKLIKRDQNL